MALVGQPAMLGHDGFVGDGVSPPFMDAGSVAFEYGYGYDDYHYQYQPHLLEEECLLGSRAWELPTGVLGADQPGEASAFDGHDFGWAHASGVSSPSSVLTFHDPTATASSASHKRPRAHAQAQQATEQASGGNPKRQCGGDRKAATKPRKTSGSSSPPKDTTSDAAKNRRERIGERLRALQELVPNGSKVDMVTMLDKAITYVKFMQLQLTVLETDAFWPAQGGEAPEISQVKGALDAIILSSSQKNHQRS